jgi:hypothetical protein
LKCRCLTYAGWQGYTARERSQTWLHGIGDALSEIGKLMYEVIGEDTEQGERFIKNVMNLRKKFLKIAEILHGLLDHFETSYEMVMKTTFRPGYGNTYRALLQRIRGIIASEKKAFAEDRMKFAFQDWIKETIKEGVIKELKGLLAP